MTTELRQLEEQIQALKDLIEVAKAVVSTLDLDTVLQAILDSAMRFAETPAGSIALYDEERQELSLHAHAGLTTEFIRHERWGVSSGGLTEHVLGARSIVYLEDTTKTPFFRNPVAVGEGIRSMVCLPLTLHEHVVGILYLDDFVPRKFDREKMNLLSVLASFAAMAIDNAKLHNNTKLMAITDALTGLFNHRYFHQVLNQELERARRYGKPLSIIMMDVDNFKGFNDRYGHFNGDKVLSTVGQIIARTSRSVDSGFRYGGEEFCIILPETKLLNAVAVAERLRETVEREASSHLEDIPEKVTVSIGVAAYPFHGKDRSELLNRVDALLYRAKSQGKNRVHYDPFPEDE